MKRANEDGFTLIEVLVSLVVLSGAILLAFETGANSVRAIRSAEQKTKAMDCLLYTSPSPRDRTRYRMPSSA